MVKGVELILAPVWREAITNEREANLFLDTLREEKQSALQALHALECRARAEGGHLSAVVVRRRGGGLLWRKRSRTPKQQTLFELLGRTGQAFLDTLSPKEQRWCLNVEAERLRLELHWTLLSRASVNVERYLDRYRTLRYRRKSLPTE